MELALCIKNPSYSIRLLKEIVDVHAPNLNVKLDGSCLLLEAIRATLSLVPGDSSNGTFDRNYQIIIRYMLDKGANPVIRLGYYTDRVLFDVINDEAEQLVGDNEVQFDRLASIISMLIK